MKKFAIIITILNVVIFACFYIFFSSSNDYSTAPTSSEYELLADRVFEDIDSQKTVNFSPLRRDLKQYFIDNNISGGLYFEYLPTGTSIRVNGDFRFRAASLMKLPLAMETYRAIELGKLHPKDTVILKEEWLNSDFGNLYLKGAGYAISVEELVSIMLTESDNTASRALLSITEGLLDTDDLVLGYLDIDFVSAEDGSIDVGARSYSSFLKCLYFACYNTEESSNKILSLITESDFNNRLVAGVGSESSAVAHKIGVFNTQVQSDCGIIYMTGGNYLLCVMLNGDDDETTNSHIANLSKIAYEYILN